MFNQNPIDSEPFCLPLPLLESPSPIKTSSPHNKVEVRPFKCIFKQYRNSQTNLGATQYHLGEMLKNLRRGIFIFFICNVLFFLFFFIVMPQLKKTPLRELKIESSSFFRSNIFHPNKTSIFLKPNLTSFGFKNKIKCTSKKADFSWTILKSPLEIRKFTTRWRHQTVVKERELKHGNIYQKAVKFLTNCVLVHYLFKSAMRKLFIWRPIL